MAFSHIGGPVGPSNLGHTFDYVSMVEYMVDFQGSCLMGYFGMGPFLSLGSVVICYFDLCANFQLFIINRILPRTPCSQSHTWRMLMIPHWI